MNIHDIFANLNRLIDISYKKGDWCFRQELDDFLLSMDKIDEHEFIFELCQSCLELKNSDYVRDLLEFIDAVSCKDKKLIGFYNELIIQGWHDSHEEVVRHLEYYLDKTSLDYLYRSLSIKNDWCDTAGYYALHKKVIWAIFKIDGKKSLPVINSYRHKMDKDVQKDLSNWINRRMQ